MNADFEEVNMWAFLAALLLLIAFIGVLFAYPNLFSA